MKSESKRGVAMLSPWFGMTGIGPDLQVWWPTAETFPTGCDAFRSIIASHTASREIPWCTEPRLTVEFDGSSSAGE